jgi:hypothetical protein
MKRIIHFAQALKAEYETIGLTADQKRTICEDAKAVIAFTMTGAWALLATALVNDLEKTIK